MHLQTRLAHCGLALALCLGLTQAAQPAVAAPTGVEEQLPAPPGAPTPSVPNFGTTVRPDGTPIAVIVSGGAGGRLNIVDLNTAQSKALPFASLNTDVQPWGFATLKDKRVLIGAGKHLYRYDPADDSVTQLSTAELPGYEKVKGLFNHIWDVTVDEHNTAYLATQSDDHGGHILTFHPTKGWGVLSGGDPVDAREHHVRSIAYDRGAIYAGTGANNPRLYRIDPSNGAKQEVSLPGHVTSGSFLYQLEVHAGVAYVGHSDGSGTTAVKVDTGGWLKLENVGSAAVKRPGDDVNVYFYRYGMPNRPAGLVRFDPRNDSYTPVVNDSQMVGRFSPNNWASKDVFVSTTMEGVVSIYHSGDAASKTHTDLVQTSPRAIQSLTAADNGSLFASWYMTTPGLLKVNPAATAKDTSYEVLPAPVGQGEGMVSHGDQLVTGLYPSGQIAQRSVSTDQSKPPVAIGRSQDRPYAMVHTTANQYAIGTVPVDGDLGGALTIYDAGTGAIAKAGGVERVYEFEKLNYAPGVRSDLLTEQAPVSLAYRNGKVYIGTTIRGGHTSRAKDSSGALEEAHILEFDLASQRVTRVVNPFPGTGQRAITAMAFSDDGKLWASTGQYVFSVAPATLQVQQATSISPGGSMAVNRSWLEVANGQVYAVIAGALWALPMDNLEAGKQVAEPGATGVGPLELADDGYLYYARGAELFRMATSG